VDLNHYFSYDGGLVQNRLVETAAAVFMGTTWMRKVRNLVLWVGLHQFIAMGTGIICDCDTNGPDTRVGLHALEGHNRRGKFSQVRFTIHTRKGIVWGGSIAFRTSLHNGLLIIYPILPQDEKRGPVARVFQKERRKENVKPVRPVA
jgi:hypothetical protein